MKGAGNFPPLPRLFCGGQEGPIFSRLKECTFLPSSVLGIGMGSGEPIPGSQQLVLALTTPKTRPKWKEHLLLP